MNDRETKFKLRISLIGVKSTMSTHGVIEIQNHNNCLCRSHRRNCGGGGGDGSCDEKVLKTLHTLLQRFDETSKKLSEFMSEYDVFQADLDRLKSENRKFKDQISSLRASQSAQSTIKPPDAPSKCNCFCIGLVLLVLLNIFLIAAIGSLALLCDQCDLQIAMPFEHFPRTIFTTFSKYLSIQAPQSVPSYS